jgi:hypothetical protein
MNTNLPRRNILRGLGVSLALPGFQSLQTGFAAPKESAPPRRLLSLGNHLGFHPPSFFPKQTGTNYQTSPTLKNIDQHRKNFTVLSHLDHDVGGGHNGVEAFLSGIRKEESSGFPERNISLDQIAAEHSGSATRFPSINAGLGEGTDMCWTRTGVRIPPINNPARLFEALFVQDDGFSREQQRQRLGEQSSILDALNESAKSLHRDLNHTDRDKLDQYLTSIRNVEQRLQMSEIWLDKPKPNPGIDPITDEERQHIEELPLFFDLITLALQTDSTRIATFEIPMGFTVSDLDKVDLGYHGLSHHSKGEGKLAQLKVVEDYIFTQVNRLLNGLQEAQLLDHTLFIMGSGMSDASTHSNKDLPVLLAGGGIKHKGHLDSPHDHHRVPLCNLWLSALQWFGLKRERFGKSTGTFSKLKFS